MAELKFVDWESRPAVISNGRAWAVLAPGEDWTPVNSTEVGDSGALLTGEDEMRAVFASTFGQLPPLPTDVQAAHSGAADYSIPGRPESGQATFAPSDAETSKFRQKAGESVQPSRTSRDNENQSSDGALAKKESRLTVGAGVEVMLADNVSLKTEYRYTNYQAVNIVSGDGFDLDGKSNLQTVRSVLNWQF